MDSAKSFTEVLSDQVVTSCAIYEIIKRREDFESLEKELVELGATTFSYHSPYLTCSSSPNLLRLTEVKVSQEEKHLYENVFIIPDIHENPFMLNVREIEAVTKADYRPSSDKLTVVGLKNGTTVVFDTKYYYVLLKLWISYNYVYYKIDLTTHADILHNKLCEIPGYEKLSAEYMDIQEQKNQKVKDHKFEEGATLRDNQQALIRDNPAVIDAAKDFLEKYKETLMNTYLGYSE